MYRATVSLSGIMGNRVKLHKETDKTRMGALCTQPIQFLQQMNDIKTHSQKGTDSVDCYRLKETQMM